MGNFFSVDGALFKFMLRLLDMLKLNFLWLICSLPIVTFGPATIAAFSVTMEMVDDTEGYIAKKFFKTFKANMKNGIPHGLLFIIACYALWIDFQLMTSGENPFVFTTCFILAAFVFLLGFMFSFALQVKYENTLIKTLKNSYDICIRYFVRTILLIVVLGIEAFIFFFNYTMMFFWILIGPACMFLTISGFAVPFFREIEKEDGAIIAEEAKEIKKSEAPKGIASRAHMNTKNK